MHFFLNFLSYTSVFLPKRPISFYLYTRQRLVQYLNTRTHNLPQTVFISFPRPLLRSLLLILNSLLIFRDAFYICRAHEHIVGENLSDITPVRNHDRPFSRYRLQSLLHLSLTFIFISNKHEKEKEEKKKRKKKEKSLEFNNTNLLTFERPRTRRIKFE